MLNLDGLKGLLNFHWLAGVPLVAAQAAFLVLFVIIAMLVLSIPTVHIHEGLERPRWWHNLKLWAWGVLLMIFVTYCLF
ncbi:MAG: hypothetical protein MUC88_13090 [Planctomycetes bacterium]|nr:hypothetical protein [Planctomycetota bacterium]